MDSIEKGVDEHTTPVKISLKNEAKKMKVNTKEFTKFTEYAHRVNDNCVNVFLSLSPFAVAQELLARICDYDVGPGRQGGA
jgi:hypothetical protein